MSEQAEGRHNALRSLAAAAASLCGVTAASAAVAYQAAVGTDTSSVWRDWLGPLGLISLWAAFGAVALGTTVLITGESRSRRAAVAAIGAGLGLLALGFWFWVLEGILDTT